MDVANNPDDRAAVLRRRVIAACAAVMFLPLVVPLVTRTVWTQLDLALFHIPVRSLYANALRAGHSILWTPAMFSGFYVHAEGQIGVLHPWHLLLYRLLPLDVAMNIEIATSYAIAFGGMFHLLRHFGLSRDGSVVGAVLFAFSGFNLLHLNQAAAVAVAAHMPWVLFAADVVLTDDRERRRAWGCLGLAGAVGSQLLLGSPQYVWMTFLALAVLCACRAKAGFRRFSVVAAALAAGLAIGAVQVIPTLELARESRMHLPAEARMSFSLHPFNLVQLWLPYAYPHRVFASAAEFQVHEFGVYNGAYCSVALVWVITRFRALGVHRSLAAALLIAALLALVLALGRYGGVYPLLTRLPVVGAFRAPARHIVLLHLALSGIAAIAFDDLAARLPLKGCAAVRLSPIALLAVLSSVTAMVIAASRSNGTLNTTTIAMLHVLAGAASIVLTAILVALSVRGRAWALPAVVVVMVFDLGYWGYAYPWPPEPLVRIAERANEPREAHRGEYLAPLMPPAEANYLLMRRHRIVNAYVGLMPARRLPPIDATSTRLAGARWQQTSLGSWVPVPDPMPRARLVAKARVTADLARDLPDVDIAETATLDVPVGPLTGAPGAAVVVRDVPGHVTIDIEPGGRQLLVLTERFHEGWRATIDGRRADTVRVYGDYLGCVVSRDSRRVEFRFAPRSVRIGGILTASGVVLAAALFVVIRRRALP